MRSDATGSSSEDTAVRYERETDGARQRLLFETDAGFDRILARILWMVAAAAMATLGGPALLHAVL